MGRAASRRLGKDVGILEELEFHWGSAYHLAVIDGVCTARRRDGKGAILADALPEGLRLQIVADYERMPVPTAHPEVIVGDGGFGTVQARIPEPHGEIVITRYTLRELLDRLGELTGTPADPDHGDS